MSNRKTRKAPLWSKLSNEGPQPRSTVSKISIQLRQDGVMIFNPSINAKGTSQSGLGNSQSVVYIEGKHSAKTVLKKWLEVNKKKVQQVTDMAVHQRVCDYGDEFREASKEILGPFEAMSNRGGDCPEARGGSCNMCGEDYDRYLADHLPECEG